MVRAMSVVLLTSIAVDIATSGDCGTSIVAGTIPDPQPSQQELMFPSGNTTFETFEVTQRYAWANGMSMKMAYQDLHGVTLHPRDKLIIYYKLHVGGIGIFPGLLPSKWPPSTPFWQGALGKTALQSGKVHSRNDC
jgi:hypothetical protein